MVNQTRRKEQKLLKKHHHQDAALACLAEINPQLQLTQNKTLNKEGPINYGMIRKMQEQEIRQLKNWLLGNNQPYKS